MDRLLLMLIQADEKMTGGGEPLPQPPDDRNGCATSRVLKLSDKNSVDGSTLQSHGLSKALTLQRNHAHAKRGRSCTLSPGS